MSERDDAARDGVRVDLWLWAARFFKTRALAKQAIESGKVEVNGQTCKPSRAVHVGDALRIVRGDERFEIEALGLSERRGSAQVAQTLYRESEESQQRRAAEREQRRLAAAGYQPPRTKPERRARKLIQALGDIDAF